MCLCVQSCIYACKLALKTPQQQPVFALDCFNNNTSRGIAASTAYTHIPATSNNLFTFCFPPQTAPKNKLQPEDKDDPPAPKLGQTFGLSSQMSHCQQTENILDGSAAGFVLKLNTQPQK